MKAIVLAGDKGFGIDGFKEDVPKALLPLLNKPMVNYVLGQLEFIPKQNIIIVGGYQQKKLASALGSGYKYALQERPLGTGDAVLSAKNALENTDDHLLICYSDMPLITSEVYEGIVAHHKETGADCTILTAVAAKTGLRYGRIIRDSSGDFSDILEYEETSTLQKEIDELNIGIYVFKGSLLFEYLEKLGISSRGDYPLTDIPKQLLTDGYRVATYPMTNTNQIYGINNADQLKLCSLILTHSQQHSRPEPQKWFGTGGWRAFIGESFTKDNVQLLSQAISEVMLEQDQSEMVIGYDRRFLSDKAAIWAAEVFAGNGIDVYFISRISPTPLVMFTVKHIGAQMGLCITASHNPADYNGMKLFLCDGSDAPLEITDTFEEKLNAGVTPKVTSFDQGVVDGIIHMIDPNNDYIDSIISMIDMQAIRDGGLKVLLDPMFGVSKTTLQTVLVTARCEVDIINDRHDTLFGGQLPSPTEKSLSKLIDMVVQHKYDLGIGTDGDADRVGIVDNNGDFVHPNQILTLLYHYMIKYKGIKGDCVRNLATTHILDKIAEKYGQTCHEVPVGFKNISAKMAEYDAIIGGESSGGLTIKGHIKGKDGIFAAALVVEMICVTGKTIPQLIQEINSEYGYAYNVEAEFSFSDEKKAELVGVLFEQKEVPAFSYPISKVSYMDGCKVYFENNGWVVVRFSGTEPLLRIFSEMPSEQMAQEVIDNFTTLLKLGD